MTHGTFVERHGLWNDVLESAGLEVESRLAREEIDLVRFSFPDQHGVLRGKTLVSAEARSALRNGVSMTSTLLAKDTSHRTVFPVFARGGGFNFPGMQGGADVTLVADPTTFKVLPWAHRTGWVLCDVYSAAGTPSPLATRPILRRATERLRQLDYEFVAGLEVEFHVFRLDDAMMGLAGSGQPGDPPSVSLLSHGYQYLTESRFDSCHELTDLLYSELHQLGLPLRSLEIEYGPSQFELTLLPASGLASADSMVLLRTAIKQICRRRGLHASFMCRPNIPNAMSSGWHLHQSLRDGRGNNVFAPGSLERPLSETGMRFLAGLREHAPATSALANPTINAYRRFRPFSLAPDRANWGRDNRGVMLRVLSGADQSSNRIENRLGEPAANPYLYLASQIYSGLDGLERNLDPGVSADAPYDTPATQLPTSLAEALTALESDTWLRGCFGQEFIEYYCRIKRAEIARFNLEVTPWEQREYFDLF